MKLPCARVESYARLHVKTRNSLYRTIRRPEVPRTRYRYHVFVASSTSHQIPLSDCRTKRVTPLKSSHGYHIPTRADSARAARGRCVESKRRRHPDAGRARRVQRIVSALYYYYGRIKLRLTAEVRGACKQVLTMVHTHPPHHSPPLGAVPRVPG